MSPTANRTQELLNDSTCPYNTESGFVWARFFRARIFVSVIGESHRV